MGVLASLLHDFWEDAPEALVKKNDFKRLSERFGEEVANTVAVLTRKPGLSDEQYYAQIAQHPLARVIKVFDRINNLQCAGSLPADERIVYMGDTRIHVLQMAEDMPEAFNTLQRLACQANPARKIYQPRDPIAVARMFGGVTFEIPPRDSASNLSGHDKIGWWTYSNGSSLARSRDPRHAVYIPTIQKDGIPVSSSLINELKAEAAALGLSNLSQACGVWILGDDPSIPEHLRGTAQSETIWIAWGSPHSTVSAAQLEALAAKVRDRAVQDCVAYEISGHLGFSPGESLSKRIADGASDHSQDEQTPQTIDQTDAAALVVVPLNDAESVEVLHFARSLGLDVVVTHQPWGASWEAIEGQSSGLEPEVVAYINRWRALHPQGQVYGLELKGSNPFHAINIDHHPYRDGQGEIDNRSSDKSSFTLFADRMKKQLTPYQRLIAANQAASHTSIQAELRRQGIEPSSAVGRSWVSLVRLIDRCAQGVTPDHEAQAVHDISNATRNQGKVLVEYNTPLWTPQADRLLADPSVTEHLHVPASGAGRWVYYGPRRRSFDALNLPHSWMGGTDQAGYFGVVDPSPEQQAQLRQVFWGSARASSN